MTRSVPGSVLVVPISEADADSFHVCLDAVARERRFLALLEAPSLESLRGFVAGNVANGVPQVVAKDGARVVGWCDIQPGWPHARRHCGCVGMGLLPAYRGQGIGRRLLEACLAQARQAGITRVELEARADNEVALRLYTRMGFAHEGTKRGGMRVDGQDLDTLAMALLLDAQA
jgi:ribosomal protein S18 acetylase RimI-like enzyme